MTQPSPISAEAQLAFLSKLQRLFAEGDFTATYKFALLVSLADIAVEHGSDNADRVQIPIRLIADRFVSLYWQQTSPYGSGRLGSVPGVIAQNAGAQAAVVRLIESFRSTNAANSVLEARASAGYPALISAVAAVVSAQPLNYLQNFGGGSDPFIFKRAGKGAIALEPGVSFCLRRFYPLVQQLSRSSWVAHIKGNKRNRDILGDSGDLEDFLFSASRQALGEAGRQLRKLDGSRCFYCGDGVGAADVDHFIPFSLYPRDLMHNLVLSHPDCNRSKSDTLAARSHLERWLNRIEIRGSDLDGIGREAGILGDASTTRRVTSWSYRTAAHSGAKAWITSGQYENVDSRYTDLLSETAADRSLVDFMRRSPLSNADEVVFTRDSSLTRDPALRAASPASEANDHEDQA